jgi:hypothetical protein
MMTLSATELAAAIATLKWAETELRLIIEGETDREAASDLQVIIETLQEAIAQLQQN